MLRRAPHQKAVRQHILAESIVYLCTLIADQPRTIDRYIDYFGDARALRAAHVGRRRR
jgi:hypothetical protein